MAIEKVYLDPNAAAYANLAALDSAAATKLSGIEAGAQVNPSATGIRDAIVGLSDDTRKILITRPTSGQKRIYAVQTHSNGKTEIEQSDTVES